MGTLKAEALKALKGTVKADALKALKGTVKERNPKHNRLIMPNANADKCTAKRCKPHITNSATLNNV